ncbi:MAG TPA: accessory factor UbiK family protein [Burkholderiales bacterium]|jgi:BMFP domain-containing protein YqiC
MTTGPLDQIMSTIARLLPKTPEQTQRNLHAALADVLGRLDLVTREELEVQETVLARTRERLKEMEQRIVALERESAEKK